MKQFQVFNPEHDMALANGDKHFIAPMNIREMARDLTPLLEVMQCTHPLVWGWDAVVTEQLRRQGIPTDELPTEAALAALRTHSERKMAHQMLHTFRTDKPDGPYAGESILVHTLEEIRSYAAQHGHIVLKDPLSSSGKGLRHVNTHQKTHPIPPCEGGGTDISEPQILPHREDLGGSIFSWANALIRRHGYITAEPYYNKVQDFAMEFYVQNGQCRFIGYSLFSTNDHGRYEESILMKDERIEELLEQYIPCAALHEVRDWVIEHFTSIVPSEWDTEKFPLYFGIDMMVVKTTNNRQQTTDDSQFSIFNSPFRIHPCVEINLRLNMGIIAHEVRQRILAPQAEGTFHVQAFPTPEMLKDFHQKQLTAHPATYKEGRVAAGYHPLTPILPDTKHHAYIIVRQQTTDNGQPTTDNGQQTTDNGQQTTDNGQRTTDNGQPTTNREQSSSLGLLRCEGGKACKAGLTDS